MTKRLTITVKSLKIRIKKDRKGWSTVSSIYGHTIYPTKAELVAALNKRVEY